MKLSIRHETHYEYSAPLKYALQHLCLTPQANAHQEVVDWQLTAPGHLYAGFSRFKRQFGGRPVRLIGAHDLYFLDRLADVVVRAVHETLGQP